MLKGTRQSPNHKYKVSRHFGIAPFHIQPRDLGRGGLRYEHPMNAHLAFIDLVHRTPEVASLRAAVDACLADPLRPFVLRFNQRDLTSKEQLALGSAVYNMLVQFWMLDPEDQKALPILVRYLHENDHERAQSFFHIQPLAVQEHYRDPNGIEVLFVDGYFNLSIDEPVDAAFAHYHSLSETERKRLFPVGAFAFHALVLEERKKVTAANVALIVSNQRFSCTSSSLAPSGFATCRAEPLPGHRRDPDYLSAADYRNEVTVVSAIVFWCRNL